jgi:hypothetical protein
MEVKLTLDNLNQTEIPEEGIVLFDKPKGKSSFYAVAVVRAKLKNQAGRKIRLIRKKWLLLKLSIRLLACQNISMKKMYLL